MFPKISNLKVIFNWVQLNSFMEFQCLYAVEEIGYMLVPFPFWTSFAFFEVIICYPNVFPFPLNGFSSFTLDISMSTNVEQASNDTQTTIKVSPSTATGPKISMFAKKSGFVIPKNKLSGSLVPILRGKKGSSKTASEESTKQVQRKTKWGLDLSQDTAVKKGRALAYQVPPILLKFGLQFPQVFGIVYPLFSF